MSEQYEGPLTLVITKNVSHLLFGLQSSFYEQINEFIYLDLVIAFEHKLLAIRVSLENRVCLRFQQLFNKRGTSASAFDISGCVVICTHWSCFTVWSFQDEHPTRPGTGPEDSKCR